VGAEASAVRERAGVVDLSSFGKIAVEGRGAFGLLQRVSANDIDKPVGSVVYTQWCDERGGMVADVTVTRLAADAFRVVTGAGYLASEMAWLCAHRRDDEAVTIRDVSADLATIGLWGPQARDVVVAAGALADEVGDEAIPVRRAGQVHIGPAAVDAARISYAGELGWELTTPIDWAVVVWDRLRAAGAEPVGYRAIDALRMEKGYRYYGTDLTMLDTPFDAGLGPFVRLGKGAFVGSEALAVARDAGTTRRLRTLVIGGADYEPIYGGEAVRLDGEVVGRLRSVAYGPTVARTIGYAYLPTATAEGSDVAIDVFDRRVGAVVGPDTLVDPRGERMRG
jgi:4-methylaminobutanoate oxidase (formaldehyde-forming)